MRIIDRLRAAEPSFSFEFFPPHTERGVESLFGTVMELAPLRPGFVSCTYPGSATPNPDPEVARRRRLTLELTRRIRIRHPERLYVLLFVALGGAWLIPPESLLRLAFAPRLVLAISIAFVL